MHNLYIVFPQKTEKWRRKVGLIHCCRWVETAWAFLVTTCWSEDKIKQRIKPSAAFKNWIQDVQKNKRSAVVLVPHLNLMEAMTWAPCFFQKFPNTGVVYRPFRTKWFEDWIRKTRERFGLQLISRKRGVAPLEKILKNGGIVSLLFDQSAGETGCLTTFFERLASTTDLPGRLIEKYGYLPYSQAKAINELTPSEVIFCLEKKLELNEPLEVVNESEKMMNGNRGKIFLLSLSFIGWAILATLTLGIGFLWLMPYMIVAEVCFYEYLLGKKENNNSELTFTY